MTDPAPSVYPSYPIARRAGALLVAAVSAGVLIVLGAAPADAAEAPADEGQARAAQSGECHVDPTGDVQELDGGDPAPDRDRADLIEHCVRFGPTLAVSAEVAEPTHPEADDNWRAGTFVGWFVDTSGNGEGDAFIDFSLDPDTAALAGLVRDVAEGEPGDVICDAGDGVRAAVARGVYHVSGIEPACLDNADDVSVSAAVFYDTRPEEGEADGAVYVDTHPSDGTFTAPETSTARADDRLAGVGRIQTAVEISQRQFPSEGDADRVYLSRGDVFADSTVGGTVPDGPILLTDRTGPAHPDVRAEIERLDPDEVVAFGGEAAISEETLADAAEAVAGSPAGTDRLGGPGRIDTAVEISRHVAPNGADDVYLARADVFADAVAGGSLSGGPILLVPRTGPVPQTVLDEIERVDPDTVFALGGSSAVAPEVLDAAAGARDQGRLAGPGRIDTAVEISRYEFPEGSDDAFLARGDLFADAVVGGTLTDGPTLLVPRTGQLPSVVAAELSRLSPPQVTALGGTAAVGEQILTQARDS